jgi:hypothetical protein
MIEIVVNAANATEVHPIILGTGDFLLILMLLCAQLNEIYPFYYVRMRSPKDASQTGALAQFIDNVATLFMTPLKNSVRQAKLNHGHGIMNGTEL